MSTNEGAPRISPISPALMPRTDRGGILGRLLSPFFAHVTVDLEAAERLRSAHANGIVVHVLRAKRILDPVFILYAAERLGLPKPLWMHDHHASKLPPTIAELSKTILGGGPALLFLRRPRTLTSSHPAYAERHIETLIALQRQLDRPILLLPETLLWTKRAVGLQRTIIDSIFGDREAPGRIRELLGFFWQYDSSRYHVGAPVNIAAVLERERGQSDRVIAKKIRWSILHHLAREDALRSGPIHRSAARTRQMVLNDPAVRRYLGMHAGESQERSLEKRADEMLRTIAADVRYGWVRVLDALIELVWNRIYDGIDVDAEGLARVRSAARRGPVVMVPSHKSHVDYLVLSQVFFRAGLMPPHVAAGDNLNFPPVGAIFRRAGAFFLRRSIRGDKLYAIVFAAYVRRLLKEGHAVEFFIEGGRSRTGKVLTPKLGLLSMCVEPVLDGSINDVSFIPVSISYEKIIEARSYARELQGGKKKKEDVGALLSTTRVLRSRYGRVYVDFEEPISLRAFAASRGIEIRSRPDIRDESEEIEGRAGKNLVTQLGHRIVFGINRVTRVTPTGVAALVLLARAQRGTAEEELYARADRLLGFLADLGARLSSALDPDTRRAAIREAIGRLAADGLVQIMPSPDGTTIFRIDDDGRRALDYYKNNVLHFFVPFAVVANALASGSGSGSREVPDEELKAVARRISRLLKLEFSFRVDQDFDANFRAAADRLVARRAVERRASDAGPLWSITINGRAEVLELAGLLAVFLDAYRLTLESVKDLGIEPMTEKRFVAQTLINARKQVLEGRMPRAEAASQPTIESAVARFIEEGVIARNTDGHLVLANALLRSELHAELTRYLAWS